MIMWRCHLHNRVFDGSKGCPVGNKSSKKSCEHRWILESIVTTNMNQQQEKEVSK